MHGILYNFEAFVGDKYGHLTIYLICIGLCFFFARKSQYYKIIVVSYIISLLVLFNPIFYNFIGERFLSGVYWRLFWIIPTGITVALVGTELLTRISKIVPRYVIGVCFVVTIVITGKLVLSRDNFSFAKNPYQLSQPVVDICDSILEDCGKKQTKAIVPYELAMELRQYTSKIGLLYGRNVDGYITQITKEENWAHIMMSEQDVKIETLRTLGLSKKVDYIVFRDDFHQYPENMEEYGYNLVESLDGYSIFKISGE